MEIHSFRTARFRPHKNEYATNHNLKLYAKHCMLQLQAKNADT